MVCVIVVFIETVVVSRQGLIPLMDLNTIEDVGFEGFEYMLGNLTCNIRSEQLPRSACDPRYGTAEPRVVRALNIADCDAEASCEQFADPATGITGAAEPGRSDEPVQ